MKSLIRSAIIHLTALQSAIVIVPGMINSGGFFTLLFSTLSLALLNYFIRPLILILVLPLNLITLGAFKWVVNVLLLYLLTLVIKEIQAQPFLFPGFSFQGFVVPEIYISTFWTLVLASAVMSITTTFLFWLSTDYY